MAAILSRHQCVKMRSQFIAVCYSFSLMLLLYYFDSYRCTIAIPMFPRVASNKEWNAIIDAHPNLNGSLAELPF